MENNVIVRLENLVVKYDDELILKGINLDIHDKEFITLLGPSGCGKTTTLRIIGGFIEPNEGNVYFDGKKINGVPPYKRQVNTVFQKYALFQHLNVYENIAFGLRLKKTPENEIHKRVMEMLEMVNLKGYGARRVDYLSGGQQQRVAVARALATKPDILFCDEPTGNLDKESAGLVMEGILSLKNSGSAIAMITHDNSLLPYADVVYCLVNGVLCKI